MVSKRKPVKAHLTIFQRFLDGIKNNNVVCVHRKLKINVDKLCEKEKYFNEIQEQI